MTEHWLVAYDDAQASRRALAEAVRALEGAGGRVTLLHVIPEAALGSSASAAPNLQELRARARDDVREELLRVATRVAEDWPSVDMGVLVREGDPDDQIVAVMEDIEPDVTVLGTHGRRGLERLMLGSVTERVVNRAGRPVLVVPPTAEDAPPRLPAQVVCVALSLVDDENGSTTPEIVQHAVRLARRQSSRLLLVHVPPPPVGAFGLSQQILGLYRESRARDVDSRREKLERIADRVAGQIEVETELVDDAEGVVAGVVRAVTRAGAGLVVLAAREQPNLQTWLLGSQARRLIRSSPVPVLVVPGPARRGAPILDPALAR